MELRRGMVWGVAITLMSGVITFAYLSQIANRSLEGLVFFPIAGVLSVVAGVFGGWRGRTGIWAVGLSLGSGALLIIAEAIWLVVSLLTRQPSTAGNGFTDGTEQPVGILDGTELFSVAVLAGLSTVTLLIGLVLALSISGWLPAHWVRGRMLR
jgi:hypothetical protein